MDTNINKYENDLKKLIQKGEQLKNAMAYECNAESLLAALRKSTIEPEEQTEFFNNLPRFNDEYQNWYSEALVLIKQILPNRLSDFVKYYEKPGTRKNLTYSNYVIQDYLQGITVTGANGRRIAGPDAAIPQFHQQFNILKSVQERFKSSLFDIKQLVQADLFDSEVRKYKVGLFLTHQYLEQLPEEVRSGILGNVGTIICFRLGTADAKIMEHEFYPVFTLDDFLNLPRFHIYLKLLIDGVGSKGFSADIALN